MPYSGRTPAGCSSPSLNAPRRRRPFPPRQRGLVYIPAVLWIAFTILFGSISGNVSASEPARKGKNGLPDLEKTGVVVPWEDFKKILDEIRRGDPIEPPPPPPVDYALSGCGVKATVAGDQKQVRVNLEFSIQVLQSTRWVEVPVISEGVALSRFQIDGRPANVYRKSGYHRVALKGEGRRLLSLEYLTQVSDSRGTRSIILTFPAAPVTQAPGATRATKWSSCCPTKSTPSPGRPESAPPTARARLRSDASCPLPGRI